LKIHRSIEGLSIQNPVITVGTMDGVHLGHQLILKRLQEQAERLNGESVLITFWPHPRMVVHHQDIRLLNLLNEKILVLKAKTSLQHLVILDFTKDLSQLPPQDFIATLLYPALRFKGFLVGYDHHFGRRRAGDFDLVQSLGQTMGFESFQVEALQVEGDNVSSTNIRNALAEGEVKKANAYLGYPYKLEGTIVKGDALGRTLGFPTANLQIEPYKLLPANGVYAVRAKVKNHDYNGMLNIGVRPTLKKQPVEPTVEVHLFDFEEDIYGQSLVLELCDFVRNEQPFSSLDALKKQLQQDKLVVQSLLS